MTRAFTAHEEHTPRPAGDPDYVPYWAKGEYARARGTKYTTESGALIIGGELKEGPRKRVEAPAVSRPLPEVQSARKTPSVAPEPYPKREKSVDAVGQLLQTHKTLDARTVLCKQHGIDPAILTTAPNPGVASMRLANALRRVLGG